MPTPTPAFTVSRGIRGTVHVFQVYAEPKRLCFVRVGAGPGAELAAAVHGGLIGALVSLWISSARKKKEQRRIEENRSRTVDQMLAEHKVNHAVALTDISDVSLEPGNWAMKKGTVIWRFQIRGEMKKSMGTFMKREDIAGAMNVLPRLFPQMRVDVEWNERSGKYLKKKA